MVRVYMFRHGNTFHADETPVQVGCRTDLSLTPRGIEQAENVLAWLTRYEIEPVRIYSGHQKRQQQSAALASQHYQQSIELSSSLDELDYGLWEGKTVDEMLTTWPSAYRDWKERGDWPNEVFPVPELQVLTNLREFLTNLSTQEGDVIAYTSQGILWLVAKLCLIQNGQSEFERAQYHVNTGHGCILALDKEQFSIEAWNIQPER